MRAVFKKKIIVIIITIIVLIFIGNEYRNKYINKHNYDNPMVSVGIKSKNISSNDVIIYWTVKNKSNIDITFKENNIQLCRLDTSNYQLETTKEIILNPNDTYEYQFTLKNLSTGYHSISMTAKCEEGTTAKSKYSFEIE